MALTASGDVLVGGIRVNSANRYATVADLTVARLMPDGSLDRSFGHQGVAIVPDGDEIEAMAIAPTPSGGVVIQGGNGREAFLAKLGHDGTLDRRFGRHGYVENIGNHRFGVAGARHPRPGFAVMSDGKLLTAASEERSSVNERVVVVRLRADGGVDRSYGHHGWAADPSEDATAPEGVELLPDGKLAVATTFGSEPRDFGAIVFDHDGRLDRRFAAHGSCRARGPRDQEARDIAVVDGRAVVMSSPYQGDQSLLACPPLP